MNSIKLIKKILLSISALLMFGCITFPSVNQDPAKNNAKTFNEDFKECKESYPEMESGVNIRQWVGCMNLKGWK